MSQQACLIPEMESEPVRQPAAVPSLPLDNLMLDQCRAVLSLIVHHRPGMCVGEVEIAFHAVTGLKPCFGWIADLVETRQVPGVGIAREGRCKRFYPMPMNQ